MDMLVPNGFGFFHFLLCILPHVTCRYLSMTIAGLKRLLDAIRGIGRRYPGVLKRMVGESVEQQLERARQLLREALHGATIDEVVLDGTNRLRFAFARAVLKGIAACHGVFFNDEETTNWDTFFDKACQALIAELYPYMVFCAAVGAKHLVIGLDGMKKDVQLMQKGRASLDRTSHEERKLERFQADCSKALKPGQASSNLTSGEAFARVAALVASLLHETQAGHALTEMLVEKAIDVLQGQFSSTTIHHCVVREADFLCLNGSFTFRAGELVERDANTNVAVITWDGDLATQVPFGAGCRTRKFYQVILDGGDVCVRQPQDMWKAVLKEVSVGFVERVGDVQSLFLENIANISPSQQLALFYSCIIGGNDYTARGQHFLEDEDGRLPSQSFFLLLRAFGAICMNHADKGMVPDISLPHLIWLANAENGFAITKLDSTPVQKKRRERLCHALEMTSNQVEWFYQLLSRAVTMFPRLTERLVILPVLLSFFPEKRMPRLYATLDRRWIKRAQTLEFPFESIEVDPVAARKFLQEHFARPDRQCVLRPDEAVFYLALVVRHYSLNTIPVNAMMRVYHVLGGRLGVVFSQERWTEYFNYFGRIVELVAVPLKWRRAGAEGKMGPGTEPLRSSPKKRAKRSMTEGDGVEDVQGYFDAQGGEHSVEDANVMISNFYEDLLSNASKRETLLKLKDQLGDLTMDHVKICQQLKELGVPTLAPFGETSASTILLLGVAGSAKESPLSHCGLTGSLARAFVERSKCHLPNVSFVSTDVFIEPEGEQKCTCGATPFKDTFSWHLYYGDCAGGSCQGPDFEDDEEDVSDSGDAAPMDESAEEPPPCQACDHVVACKMCRAIRECNTCRSFNDAVFASRVLSLYCLFSAKPFGMCVTIGREAQDLLALVNLARRNHGEEELSTSHMLHVGLTVKDDATDGLKNSFFNSVCNSMASMWAKCGNRDSPLSPQEQVNLYDFFRANVKGDKCGFRQILSMERLKEFELVRQKGKIPSSKGTFGLMAQDGFVPRPKKKNKIPKKCDPSFEATAVRCLVPAIEIVARSPVAHLAVGDSLELRHKFAQLVLHRFAQLASIYNKLRLLNMCAHLLRVVGASEQKLERVPSLQASDCKWMLERLTISEKEFGNLPEGELLSFGIAADLQAAFQSLRRLGHNIFLSLPEALQTNMAFSSLFKQPLGDDATWRIDVPARGQLLGMLRLLLFLYTGGVTNDAALALYFVFTPSLEGAEEELCGEVEEDGDDYDVAADGEDLIAQAFVEEGDNDSHVSEVAKKIVPTQVKFLMSCQLAWQRMSSSEQKAAFSGAKAFRRKLLEIIPGDMLKLKDDGAAEPPQKVRQRGDVAERIFPPGSGEAMAKLTAWDRFVCFKKGSSFGAKSGSESLQDKQGNIASVRARVFGLLMDELKSGDRDSSHPGFCLSPLPRTAVAMSLQASMFYTSKTGSSSSRDGAYGSKKDSYGLEALRKWLIGPPSPEEQQALGVPSFDPLDDAKVRKMTLPYLFPVGGFSNGAPLSSVSYSGGGYLSALSLKQKKTTATRLLKSNESNNKLTFLPAMFGSKEKRDEKRAKAKEKAKKRHGAESQKLHGPDARVPVGQTRGYVTEQRFFENLSELRAMGKFFTGSTEGDLPQDPGGPVLFTILLQSLAEPNMDHVKLLLAWLKEHPLVVLDPGLRWIVCGIVARLVKWEVVDGTIKLEFGYRRVRISGRKWNHYSESGLADSFGEQQLEQTIRGAVDQLSDSAFLRAEDKTAFVQNMFGSDLFPRQVEASFEKLLAKGPILRKEARLSHQKKLSLDFVRKIDSLCAGHGDPIVIVGAAGGNGGRGRAQVKHSMLLDTLAGFFTVILLNEFCTSKKTSCCHQDASVPSKGRSRCCKHCGTDNGKPKAWWDRDVGAAW